MDADSSMAWHIGPLFKITTHHIGSRQREEYIKVAESVMFNAMEIELKFP